MDTPVAVLELTSGAQITSGFEHPCVLLKSGGVDCWGENQFGDADPADAPIPHGIPVAVAGLGGSASEVAGGGYDSCAVVGGKVYCWGENALDSSATKC